MCPEWTLSLQFGLLSLEESHITVRFGFYLVFCAISSFNFSFSSGVFQAHFFFATPEVSECHGFSLVIFLMGIYGCYFQSYDLNVLLFLTSL